MITFLLAVDYLVIGFFLSVFQKRIEKHPLPTIFVMLLWPALLLILALAGTVIGLGGLSTYIAKGNKK